MKKLTILLSLFLIVGFGTITNAQEIHIDPIAPNGPNLAVTIWGVTSEPNATYQIVQKYKFQPWTTVQSTLAPLAGTGFIGQHNIVALTNIQAGDFWLEYGKLIQSSSTLHTNVVVYIARWRCHNSNLRSIQNTTSDPKERITDMLPKNVPPNTSVTYGEGAVRDDGMNTSQLPDGLEIVQMTEEEFLEYQAGVLNQISITAFGSKLSFANHESADFKFILFDMNGKQVTSGHSVNGSLSSVEPSNIARGVYTVECIDVATGAVRSEKVVLGQ